MQFSYISRENRRILSTSQGFSWAMIIPQSLRNILLRYGGLTQAAFSCFNNCSALVN
jgi:hypothetical protein